MSEPQSGTATFLFTDIEGSTLLLKRLRARYHEVLAEHQRLLRDAFAAHAGEEIDTQGDSFFYVFGRARDAVLAAAEAQRALAAHTWPEGGDVRVRVGIHTGEANRVENRYVGVSVHRAARIAAAGHGGQVLVSQTTASIVEDEEEDLPGLSFRDLGEQRFRGLERPMRVHQLDIAGLPAEFPPLTTAEVAPAAFEAGGRRLSRRHLPAAAFAAAILIGTITAAVALSRGDSALTVLPNSVVRIDPATGKPTAVVEVGDDPDVVVTAGPYVWVTHRLLRDVNTLPFRDEGGRHLTRIDSRTSEATVVAGGLAPCGLAGDPSGDVWVASCTGSGDDARTTIVRVNAETLAFDARFEVPPTSVVYRGLAVGSGSLWIGNPDEQSFEAQTITRIDIDSGERRAIRVESRPAGIVADGDLVWVANFYDASVTVVDARTNEATTVSDIGETPSLVAVGYAIVWIADFTDNRVWRIDAVTWDHDGAVELPTIALPGVWGVATGHGAVWAAAPHDSSLWRIDPETNQAQKIVLGHRPTGVATTEDSVWVAVDGVD